jgi:hypothetical protein
MRETFAPSMVRGGQKNKLFHMMEKLFT